MKYQKKPVVVEAITFAELVAHGMASGANMVNGMPWSFTYEGQPVTHESDDCYLIPTLEGTMKMGRTDMLITGVKGEIYPCKLDIFLATYDLVPECEANLGTEGIVAAAPDRPMTFGEKAVGLAFNPSNETDVYKAKTEAAKLIDRAHQLRLNTDSREIQRMASLAITAAQEAQMWLVKAQTWKD